MLLIALLADKLQNETHKHNNYFITPCSKLSKCRRYLNLRTRYNIYNIQYLSMPTKLT